MGKNVTRLFAQFQPEQYSLLLSLDKEKMTFSGTVTVTGKKVGRPAQRITLHQKDLTIIEAKLTKLSRGSSVPVAVKRINTQASYDEVRIHTSEMIYPGMYTLEITFSGKITRQMNGIYPCFFKHQGKSKKLIATQFESHHAREAFPCIDEPEAKATFDLTLQAPAGETVISNTPIKDELVNNGIQTTSFETTPRMSTYLLAFIYGELGYKEATTKDNVKVRVYATPDNVEYTKFALSCAVKSLEFYNTYFDIPYPLAKCDLIALPDFASGAMENWGCITFREQALLVDPKNTSLHLKQYIANVVAHELTHQWFGNLVTMRWWTDLWLNESFASWMSYLAVDHLFPDWKVWVQFIVEEQGAALKQDSLENTHPIEVEVHHPDEIRTIFDAISYEKGASVLLMLHNFLGADTFRDGLRLYLKTHAYKNTDTVDLWDALEKVSKRPVKTFMGAWTSNSGYPIIKSQADDKKLVLTQERFYLNPKAKKVSEVWPIPLLPNRQFPLDTFNKTTEVTDFKENTKPLWFNRDRSGFYRVVYDSKQLEMLAQLVSEQKLNDLDRLGLLSDCFESSKAGYSSALDAIHLLEAYKNESSAVVWDVIVSGLGGVRHVMDDESIRKGLKPYIRNLSEKQLKRLGWEEKPDDTHFDKLLRPTILALASIGEETSVVKEARKRFDDMSKPEDLNPDTRGIVYGTISRIGTVKDFDKMLKIHDESTNSEERVTLAGALTNYKQPDLIRRSLTMITTERVRLQDVPYWIAYSFMNRHAKLLAWDWLKENWNWLETNLGTDLSFFRMPLYVARAFSDETFLPEFKDFFNKHLSPAFERPVKQALETIEWQAAWKKRDIAELKKYFQDYSKSS